MAYKGKLRHHKRLQIEFKCDATSGGAALVMIHWSPNGAGASPPDVVKEILPSQTEPLFEGAVPASAGRLKIEVDLPDATGSGTLTVTHEGTPQPGEFLEDDQWSYLVVP